MASARHKMPAAVKPVLNVQHNLTQGKQGKISYISANKKLFWTIIFLAETRLCLSLLRTLHFHLCVPCLIPFKVSRKEPQRSSCSSNILLQRSSCAFNIQPQRSSCGFQDSSSSDPQSAARRTSCSGRKKKFLRVHYFWAVL